MSSGHHPMLQPAAWSDSDRPAVAGRNMPRQRGRVYELVWKTALCAMRPPLLVHLRNVWFWKNFSIAAASRQPMPGQEGYWKERTDYPALNAPVNASLDTAPPPYGEELAIVQDRLVHLELRPVQAPSVGEFLQALADERIATPGGLHRLWEDLSRESSAAESSARKADALVQIEPRGNDGSPARVRLAPAAKPMLEAWRQEGLLEQTRRRNLLLDGVERGEISWRDAARDLAGPELQALADGMSRQIDEVCAQWQGLSRSEGIRALVAEQAKPPRVTGLPAWMDPEEALPPDHPLRALREAMEAELAMEHPTWRSMSEVDRGRARLDWLRLRRPGIEGPGREELDAALGESGRFSALRYWLTGLQG